FLSLVLITMSSPGWFLWTIPFLVYYQAQSGKISMLLTLLFSCLFVLNVILSDAYLEAQFIFSDNLWIPESFISILYESSTFLYTLLFCIGALLGIRFWRESVVKNIFFRLSRKPFVIGIAGDSGSGKDTLVESLTDLFGHNAVSYLTGDDYHLWDRNKPMWNAITHLNPMANDLERYASDLVALVDGDTIKTRHYDHGTGLMSHPRELHSNDFILTAGLHALYLPILRDCYDLSIYLDIDESLRRHLKIQRDVLHRGSSMEKVLDSMSKRSHDAIKFIKNQSTHADLILSLSTTSILPKDLNDFSEDQPLNLKLNVKSRMEFNEFSLRRVLIGVCGLKVDIINNDSSFELDIEGEIKGEVIAEAFELLFPELIEFLRVDPQWSNGTIGLMQLIVLSHMNQAFKKRTI
ncbi:uridine kinase, partial [Gammaproteobacteria bacterium]|nr:uridine kinase [Gammaproteobacteria bacterium]